MKSIKILAFALLLPALPSFADTCADLKVQIEGLSEELILAQNDLQDMPPSERPALQAEIRQLRAQILRLNRQLRMTTCEE